MDGCVGEFCRVIIYFVLIDFYVEFDSCADKLVGNVSLVLLYYKPKLDKKTYLFKPKANAVTKSRSFKISPNFVIVLNCLD